VWWGWANFHTVNHSPPPRRSGLRRASASTRNVVLHQYFMAGRPFGRAARTGAHGDPRVLAVDASASPSSEALPAKTTWHISPPLTYQKVRRASMPTAIGLPAATTFCVAAVGAWGPEFSRIGGQEVEARRFQPQRARTSVLRAEPQGCGLLNELAPTATPPGPLRSVAPAGPSGRSEA